MDGCRLAGFLGSGKVLCLFFDLVSYEGDGVGGVCEGWRDGGARRGEVREVRYTRHRYQDGCWLHAEQLGSGARVGRDRLEAARPVDVGVTRDVVQSTVFAAVVSGKQSLI